MGVLGSLTDLMFDNIERVARYLSMNVETRILVCRKGSETEANIFFARNDKEFWELPRIDHNLFHGSSTYTKLILVIAYSNLNKFLMLGNLNYEVEETGVSRNLTDLMFKISKMSSYHIDWPHLTPAPVEITKLKSKITFK